MWRPRGSPSRELTYSLVTTPENIMKARVQFALAANLDDHK